MMRHEKVRRRVRGAAGATVLAALLAACVAPASPRAMVETGSRAGAPERIVSGVAEDLEGAAIRVYAEASPSVVALQIVRAGAGGVVHEQGSGSGFLWDDQGHVVTCFGVVRESAAQGGRILVTMANHQRYEATLVGSSPEHDLAVLRFESTPHHLPRPIPIGSSHDLEVGQAVYAIGNPWGFHNSLTVGAIGGLERSILSPNGVEVRGCVQVDGAIASGHAGGPLLDRAGSLIGVCCTVVEPAGGGAGFGLALPVDIVNVVVPELVEGAEPAELKPLLGVLLEPTSTNERLGGAVVQEVFPDSAAERLGLRGTNDREEGWGDVIVQIDDEQISANADLVRAIRSHEFGDRIVVRWKRDGEVRRGTVTLERQPEERDR